MQAQSPWDVAIIGGGASGTLLAANLLRSARAPLRLALVERGGRVGRGLAYSTESGRHLLNVPAARMSALPDDPGHFLRWVRTESPDTPAGAFVERRRYGRYLEAVLREAAAGTAPGVHLEVVGGDVVALSDEGDRLRLSLAGGGSLEARVAVLALGNALPADLAVPDGGLYASPRYHRSPWAPGALQGIGPEEAVLLIGTGLTMVDAVLSLEEQGHRGPLHALSRHGLLPHVHPPVGTNVPTLSEPLRIRELLRTVRREVERDCGSGADASPLRIRDILRALRAEVDAATALGADWRAAVDSLRPVTIPLWQRLTLPERRRFLRHLRSHWEVHRHRMAPDVGEAIERLRHGDRLHLHAARVRGFRLLDGDGGVEVRLRRRGHAGEEVLRVGHVVNCTGPDNAMSARSHPLLRGLMTSGLACPDALGMGLATGEGGALLGADGRTSGRLYTLGPPRRGDLWETTAMPEIRVQARDLAEHVLRRLGTAWPAA